MLRIERIPRSKYLLDAMFSVNPPLEKVMQDRYNLCEQNIRLKQ